MVLSISLSCIHILYFAFGPCKWHVSWVAGISIKTPSVGDHEVKICILFNIARNVIIVLYELIQRYLIVCGITSCIVVVLLKCLHEFNKDFLFRSFTCFDVRMFYGVVLLMEFLD